MLTNKIVPALIFLTISYSFLLLNATVQTAPQVRRIKAVKAEKPPVIDGLLDDALWQTTDWQSDFYQLNPDLGKPAQATTRVAVAYDDKFIYVACCCSNPTGEAANSRITRRDGNMDLDNAVTFYLDTFRSRRDSYYFSTNSLGTQADGRIGEDGLSIDKTWDGSWTVAAKEGKNRWRAEIAIPVSEIRFPESSDRPWGVNFRRNYPDYFEESFWSETDRVSEVASFGDLVGLSGFKKRFSASLYPYIVSLNANTPSAGRKTIYSSGGTEMITGADLRFNLGTTANGNLTYNPDFATVEADQEVINLTRYETFFPEKRLYFIEGAELFDNPIKVFYSKRIGDIDYGVKTNGRAGKYNYSVLSARERPMSGNPSSVTSALRLQRDVLGTSNIGLLAVDRTFRGGYNRAFSTDATIDLPSNVKVSSQFVGSFPSSGGNFTNAYFLRAARETDIYHYNLRFTNIDPGFRDNINALGFIPDDDRRELGSDVLYRWWVRKHHVENIHFVSQNNIFWSHSGALRNVKFTQHVSVTFSNKWTAAFFNNYRTELFEKRYHNHTVMLGGGYNLQQWNSYMLLYQRGRNFDSDLELWTLRSRFKPRDNLALGYRFQHLSLSPDPRQRSTVQHVLSVDYNFTPDLYLRFFTQANNRNNRYYIYGLFGWRFAPPFGALYIAYTADRFDTFDDLLVPVFREDQRALFVKLTVPLALSR